VILGQPDVNFVFGEIGDVAGQRRGVVVHRLAIKIHPMCDHHLPSIGSADRRLRRKLMMDAVRGHPENRTAFERQRGAPGEKYSIHLGVFVAAVSQQAVIAHADAEASRNPPQEDGDEKCAPGEVKQRRDCAHVETGPSRSPCPS